ncbi:MAG: pantothenate kinase [Cyanobacteria bacterium SW_9_44_58]|nr:MAG: pantothenate kinase [Cyanobacteria bacterium SW_9_44_58]
MILGLIIGNSRLHWGCFQNNTLFKTWETPHLQQPIPNQQLPTHLFPEDIAQSLPKEVWIYLVSVVTPQTKLWENYPHKTVVTLNDIPLDNLYSTLGTDRALCAYGAGETYGYPVLVIDGGTALTYTAVGEQHNFLGGGILPGFGLQLKALAQQTDALPEIGLPDRLPALWATSTKDAIASGIIHTTITGIYNYVTAWREQYSDGVVVLTGGDAILLHSYLKQKYSALAEKMIIDQTLMFQGLANLME